MSLSALDIEKQVFGKSVLGFDKTEVESFLQKVSEELLILSNQNSDLKKEILDLKSELEKYKLIEKNLQSTLLNAQETTQKAIDEANQKAEEILENSKREASKLLNESKEHAEKITNSVNQLYDSKRRIVSELKSIIDSQEILLKRKGFLESDQNMQPENTEE